MCFKALYPGHCIALDTIEEHIAGSRRYVITAEDLYQLKAWRESNPDAPEGLWYKDFGSFKICGDGKSEDLLARGPTRQRAETLKSGGRPAVNNP